MASARLDRSGASWYEESKQQEGNDGDVTVSVSVATDSKVSERITTQLLNSDSAGSRKSVSFEPIPDLKEGEEGKF